MSYAVIRTGGKQYRVSPGELLRIESLANEVGNDVAFADVLLTSVDGAIQVGTPLVTGATVTARVVQHGKEKKILVFKKNGGKIIVAGKDTVSTSRLYRLRPST